MSSEGNSRLFGSVEFASVALMSLAILVLPVTSQPELSRLMGHSLVAPPAIVLLAVLGIFWVPFYLFKGGNVPAETRPFIAFVLVVLVSSLLAFFIKFPPYRNFNVLDGEKSALLTLLIACGVYFLFSVWFRTLKHLNLAAVFINISGLLLLTWCLAQLFIIFARGGEYPAWMVRIQYYASLRSLLDHVYLTRVGGVAYEPSWLAHQLNIIYIPFWFAATITGYSSFRKVAGISLENVLFACGFVALIFSFSRVGLLAFMLMTAYALWRLNVYGISRIQKRYKLNFKLWVGFLAATGTVILYAVVFYGILAALAHYDPRIGRLFSLKDIGTNLFELALRVDFAERVIYWANGFLTFARYPLLGVGLGNTGFFFKQHLSVLANRLTEINYVLNIEDYLPNVKSLWIRLLSETGLIGFSMFGTWFYVLWRSGKFLERQAMSELRLFGWMGLFVIVAFLAEGFSIDSFALPYLWVSLGLVTAASAMARHLPITS